MSLRARIKRLEPEVGWLNENGALCVLEIKMKIRGMLAQIHARDPELARGLGFVPPPGQKREKPPPRPTVAAAPGVAPPDGAVLVESFAGGRARIEPVPPEPVTPPPVLPEPEATGAPAAPPEETFVQPFHYDPPPEMQIRPVTWRRRRPQDYVDDPDDMYGRCIVDYDPLAYLDDDDDD